MQCQLCGVGRRLEGSRRFLSQLEKQLVGVGRSGPSRLHGPMLEAVDKEGGATCSPFSCSPPGPRQCAALPQGRRRMPLLGQGSVCRLPIRAPVRALLKGLGWDSPTSGPLLSLSGADFPPVLPIHWFQRSGITHCLLLLQPAQWMEAATGLSFF